MHYIWLCILFRKFGRMRLLAAKLNTWLNAKNKNIRKMLIHIHVNMLKNYFSNKYRACKYMTRLQYSVLSSLLCMWYWHACQYIYKKNTYDNMHCRCLISFKNLILQFKNFAYNCENIKLWMPNFNPTFCLI